MKQDNMKPSYLITAGSTYLDIDAYACAVALAELLRLKGENAVAYSTATANYSVCASLIEEEQMIKNLLPDHDPKAVQYVIVDVSDPDYIKDSVPLDRIVAVYDHHVGFEEYWTSRIGENTHIEFIGAAATLIYREWEREGVQHQMSPATARLLVAAILDNTLNLTSSNTTEEDREAFDALCHIAGVGSEFRAVYFSEVQKSVEADLKNALLGDLKTLRDTEVLPPKIAQLCVWDAHSIFARLPDIRAWLGDNGAWMLNLISLEENSSYFLCDDARYQANVERIFNVRFENGVAKSAVPYLRKQIIKKAYF